MLYSSGLQIGELLKLELKDLDFKRGVLRITMGKGRKIDRCLLPKVYI
ncbi:MAG: tyrosine-type recombinase/integrase, partial [Flavobacteriaceae bacterium]